MLRQLAIHTKFKRAERFALPTTPVPLILQLGCCMLVTLSTSLASVSLTSRQLHNVYLAVGPRAAEHSVPAGAVFLSSAMTTKTTNETLNEHRRDKKYLVPPSPLASESVKGSTTARNWNIICISFTLVTLWNWTGVRNW